MIVIDPPDDAVRLDILVSKNRKISRRVAHNWIRNGRVLVNGEIVKPAYLTSQEDLISCQPDEESPTLAPENITLDIMYEDENLIIVYKPNGMVVHPAPKHTNGTLVNALMYHFEYLSDMGGEGRPGIVHRLDKDTEGIMVVAKTNSVHDHLKKQFKDRTVDKRYYAVVKGNMSEDHYVIDQPVGRIKKKKGRRRGWRMGVKSSTDLDAKDALTMVTVIKRFTTKTLIEVVPKTGRTHQIRIHLAHIGHPLLEDPLYANKMNQKGQLLQAYYLSFIHPDTGKQLTFKRPLSTRLIQTNKVINTPPSSS
ncbi:MAG: RluA family pseudouridine synthase [Candidatus Margulisbacteria bacterium]|nr:RluA family pseudouridine synthase [Candidatus Margulisiibacteriota bacterium]